MNYITFEDAWIFLAIKYAEGERTDYYADLIGFCDYINHAIPTYEEFIAAYNKLLYISAIQREDGNILITEFGKAICTGVQKKCAPDTQPWEIAELIRIEFKPYKLKSVCRQTPLSGLEYLAAYQRYTLQ